MKLLLYGQHFKPEDFGFISDMIELLDLRNFTLLVNKAISDLLKAVDAPKIPTQCNTYESLKKENPDLILTFGGDGTILSALRMVKDSRIPIMGTNLGRLGFLSGVERLRFEEAVQAISEKTYKIEERSLLSLKSPEGLFGDSPFALNDFTLSKRDTSSMVTIHTYINGEFLNSYWADGLIVSTPTGSTGYSLSCGGPIVSPGCGNFVITPIAPHNLNVRPIVVKDDVEIMFKIDGRAEKYLCTLDSRFETIGRDVELTIKKCHFNIRLAFLSDADFMKTLREKLNWGLDKRN